MSSKPVDFEFDIACISFLTKSTEMYGILKDPLGINCSISGNELSNFSENLCPMPQKKLLNALARSFLI